MTSVYKTNKRKTEKVETKVTIQQCLLKVLGLNTVPRVLPGAS